jgi:hypothetical protein
MKPFTEIIKHKQFQVTREHIDNGECGKHDTCPIALALDEISVDDFTFSVFDFRVRFAVPKVGKYYDEHDHIYLSDGLQQWVKDFDMKETVEPITIYVDDSNPMCLYLDGETRSYMKLWPKGY